MFATSIIEVAIGLIFVYLLLSLMCSAANELLESFLKNRATDLEKGIRELFNQPDLLRTFYNHPLIKGLFRGSYKQSDGKPVRWVDYLRPTNLPSYIPARNFAYATIDLLLHPPEAKAASSDSGTAVAVNAPALPVSMGAVRAALDRNQSRNEVGRALRTLVEQSGDDVNALRENVEDWFNGSMDRVSGTYKRRTQHIIFLLGLVLTVLLNVNTVTIARRLSTDATLRSIVVAQAEGLASRPDAQKPDFEKNRNDLQGLGLPLGWQTGIDFINPFMNENFDSWDHLLLPIIGWLLTAAAISLGAPFWFDLLNKFMVIRATVKPHEKSLEEGSEDRQTNSALINAATIAGRNNPQSSSTSLSDYVMAGTGAFPVIPEPNFAADPAPLDNESHLDEGEDPILDETPDEELPPAVGGVG